MRKVAIAIILVLVGVVGVAHAFKRNGERAMPMFADRGNSFDRFATAVGTTTAVQFFSTSTYSQGVRNIQVCNTTAFQLFVGTFSTVSGSTISATNAREYVPTNTCKEIWPVTGQSLWAILESAAGSVSKIITGGVFWDTND